MDGLKTCPWCKEFPKIDTVPMWNGSHGYHGCYGVSVGCSNLLECRVHPKTTQYNTIYGATIQEATEKAVDEWNTRKGESAHDAGTT